MTSLKKIKFRENLRRHRFVLFVAIAFLITVIATVISLDIYVTSGTIKLDLSRPGYEKLRENVQKSSSEQAFSASGAVDSAALKDFNSRMDNAESDLKNTGKFGGADNLSDESLGLSN